MQTEIHKFEPFVPADEAWQKLKPILDKEEKKRRGFIWWLFASFIVVAVIGTGIYVYNAKQPSFALLNANTQEKKFESKKGNAIKSTQQLVVKSNEQPIITKTNASPISHALTSYPKIQSITNYKPKEINDVSKSNKTHVFAITKPTTNGNDFYVTSPTSISAPQLNTIQNEILETKQELSNDSHKSELINNVSKTDQLSNATEKKQDNSTSISKKSATKNKSWQYGLQWNIPFTKNVNFLNIDRANNPAVVFIPSVYFKKEVSKKSSLELFFNPYSTYYINNKTVMQQNSYNVTIAQGSRVVTNNYTETNAVNKLTSLELGLFYGYSINKQLMVRAGVSNNWSNWAMLNTTVLRNGSEVTLDTLYSISKGSTMWNNINPTFLLGKLDILYSFNKLEVGVNFTSPLKPLTNLPNDNTPINTNLFMRWRLR